jgi:hypothetical protein
LPDDLTAPSPRLVELRCYAQPRQNEAPPLAQWSTAGQSSAAELDAIFAASAGALIKNSLLIGTE